MKVDEDLATYQACRTITDRLVYASGIWPYRENTTLLYKFFGIYGLFVMFVIAFKGLFFTILNMNNITLMVSGFRTVAAMCAGVVRLLYANLDIIVISESQQMVSCLVYRKEFIFLDKELSAKFNEELEKEKSRPALLKSISLYRTFINFMNVSTPLTAVLFFIPFVIVVLKYKKYIQLCTGKYPFTMEPGGTAYWASVAFETSSLWFLVSTVAGIDNTFGMHCFRMSGFLRFASERIKNLNADDPNCRGELRECVAIHQLVLRAKVALENAYGYIVIWNYLASAGIMCSVMWEVNQAKAQVSLIKVIFAVVYIILKLSQAFIYSYFGSNITTESEKYQDAVYMSSWPGSGNIRLMKDLVIILVQRTVDLKACGFFLITMQYFEKICNATISYFFLIQTLADNN